MPMLKATAIRNDPSYSRDYVLIANSFALAFIPMTVLVILNSLIFRTISKATRLHNAISSNQRRDHSVAMMLISIVAVFIICHSLRSVINTYECVQMALHGELKNWPDWIQTLVHFNHFALVVNSSINILIYACKDEKFLNVMLVTIHMKPSGVTRSRSRSPDLELTQMNAESRSTTLERKHRISTATKVIIALKDERPKATNGSAKESSDSANGFCRHDEDVSEEKRTLLVTATPNGKDSGHGTTAESSSASAATVSPPQHPTS
jgi:hypothetical protein